jgi:hypothetical protein
LKRRDTVTGLDARDVGGRAALEGELPLAEPGACSCFSESTTDRVRIVDVC